MRSVEDDTAGFVASTKIRQGDKWKLKDLTGKAGRIILAEYVQFCCWMLRCKLASIRTWALHVAHVPLLDNVLHSFNAS